MLTRVRGLSLGRLELAQKKAYYDVGTAKGPDVYFEPRVVSPGPAWFFPRQSGPVG